MALPGMVDRLGQLKIKKVKVCKSIIFSRPTPGKIVTKLSNILVKFVKAKLSANT